MRVKEEEVLKKERQGKRKEKRELVDKLIYEKKYESKKQI